MSCDGRERLELLCNGHVIPKIAINHQRDVRLILPLTPRKEPSLLTPRFKMFGSRIMSKLIPVVLSPSICGTSLQQP